MSERRQPKPAYGLPRRHGAHGDWELRWQGRTLIGPFRSIVRRVVFGTRWHPDGRPSPFDRPGLRHPVAFVRDLRQRFDPVQRCEARVPDDGGAPRQCTGVAGHPGAHGGVAREYSYFARKPR